MKCAKTEISKNSITTKNGALILSGRDNTTASIKENILTQAGGFTSATVRLGEFIGGGPYSTNEWSFTKNKITGFGNTSTFYAANFERLQIYNQNEIKHSSSLKPGIRIDGGYQNKVQCNKSIEGKTGVLFNGSYLSRIDCNDLIKGSDAAVQILGNCEKTRIRGNAFNGTYTDLKYGETTAGYSYTGPQEYHRNLFLGSHTSDYNAINYESSVILALKSQFLVKAGMHNPCPDIDGLMPLFSSTAIDWFKQPTFGIPYPCPFSCPSSPCVVVEGLVGGGGNEVGNTDIDIRNGIVNSGAFADAINWTTQKRLYKRLTEENNQSIDYQIFLANQQTKSMGKFTNFEQSIGNLTHWNSSELVALEQLRAQRRTLKNTLASTTPYTIVSNEMVTDVAALQQYGTLVGNIRVLDEQINGMKALKKSQLLSNIPSLGTQNDAISTVNGYELNQKLVNGLLLKRLTNWDFSWEASDKNTIMAIAAQCPLSGGDAVFQARAMLIGEDDLPNWEDTQTCAVTKIEGRSDNPLQQRLTVFPNPAQQYIIIQLPESPIATTTGNITVSMYDLQGKTVAEFQFPANQTLLYLDLAKLPKGIYLGKVTRDGHPFETFKVLLEK